MALFEYQLDDHVAVVTMNSGENRFTYDFLKTFEGPAGGDRRPDQSHRGAG